MRKVDPEKHAKKRQQILKAAEICFRRDGFRGASMSGICAQAGMSPGHLYYYFKSKESIVAAMTEAHLEGIEERFAVMTRKSDVVSAICDELDYFWRNRFSKKQQHAVLVQEVLAEASRNSSVAKLFHKRNRRMEELMAAFLQRGQKLKQVDQHILPDAAAAIICGVMTTPDNLFVREMASDKSDGLIMLQHMIRRFLAPANMPRPLKCPATRKKTPVRKRS